MTETAEPYVWEPEQREEPSEDDRDFAWYWTRQEQDLEAAKPPVVKPKATGTEGGVSR